MTSHWAKTFYGNFKKLYNADIEELGTLWNHCGNLTSKDDKGHGVHSLLVPIPEYTNACMCGHYIELNCIVSRRGHDPAVVGSCCIKKFMPETKRQMAQAHAHKKDVKKMCRKIIKKKVKKAEYLNTIIRDCGNQNPRFGKYKTSQWKDVPDSYLKWCVKNDIWFDHDLKHYVKYRLTN